MFRTFIESNRSASKRKLMLVAAGLGMAIGAPAQAVDRATIYGTVLLEDIPVCAQILINGQSMFSCHPVGEYSLDVPLDAKGKATVFSFGSGMSPYRTEVTPAGKGDVLRHNIAMMKETQPKTTLVSKSSNGVKGNSESNNPSFSENGVYVAFSSHSTNLIVGDNNNNWDIFLHNRNSGVTQRVSLHSNGQAANGSSTDPDLSEDGLVVAFSSNADNLVDSDTNSSRDIFVRNTTIGTTTRASVSTSGNEGNKSSKHPSISGDGRYVTFSSEASTLVSSDTNNTMDVFLHDIDEKKTSLISVSSDGVQGNAWSLFPAISEDGQCAAFTSPANTLYPGDNNMRWDVFVHSLTTGKTQLVSVSSAFSRGNDDSAISKVSKNCRYIAFESFADNLVEDDTNTASDVFVRDMETETTVRVSVDSDGNEANGHSYVDDISSDGRYVLFNSKADNLVYGGGDINNLGDLFIHDLVSGETKLVSVSTEGAQATPYSAHDGDLAETGMAVVFSSRSTSLVRDDENDSFDIFMRRPLYQQGNR